MFDDPLSLPARLSVTLSVLLFVVQARRALLGGRPGRSLDAPARLVLAYWPLAFAAGALFSHVPALRDALPIAFPVGAALGAAVALAGLALPSLRARFDAIGDADMRGLLAYRGLFGAFLLALAAL